jgi:hypothetical protein
MQNLEQDRTVLRELAQKIAEIAALPIQEEKKRLWRLHNGLRPERPMVTIDQVCWNELNIDGKLTLRCEDAGCRIYEDRFRKTLFQWEYFPADMVVEDYVRFAIAINDVPATVNNLPGALFGMKISENTLATDTANDIVSHDYHNQFTSIDDVMEKIQMPVVSVDAAETKLRHEKAHWLFDGILPVREEGWGYDPYLSCWDPIAMWMSITGVLYGMIDNPEMMHALIGRVVQGYMTMLDQLEEQNLIYKYPQALVHTTGAWTDELPGPGFASRGAKTSDLWMYAMAQAFTTVSPAMFEEYEINYLMPLFERFGLVYYGCCDPLEDRMDKVKRIPHVRKISVSPWAKRESCAEQIGRDYVVSGKPNPAFLADTSFNEEILKKDLLATREIAGRYGCPLEFAFKDISTIKNDPARLFKAAGIAMKIVSA